MMFNDFRIRSLESERLDRGDFTHEEYVRWQKEMWFIHRLFGETWALKRTLIRHISTRSDDGISILDVGAGSGTLLNYLRSKLPGREVHSIGLEMSAESTRGIAGNGHMAVRGNALSLPFADNSVDYVFCTLLLHHLSDTAATELMIEMQRVSKQKMIVIDLERSGSSYIMFRLLGRLFLQPFTRDDGSLSIKRAFRLDEMEKLASDSGIEKFKVERSAIGRLILTADG